MVARLRAVPEYTATALSNLREGARRHNRPDRRMVRYDGLDGSAANAIYFRTTLPETARRLLGDRPFARPTLEQVTSAGAAAGDAFERFAGGLSETFDVHETVDRFAVGEAEYDWRLRHCLNVWRSSAELYEYGAEQVALYEGQVFAVAAEVARRASPADPTNHAACDQARKALYRYSKWPTQAITYNLGKNEIRALRDALRAREGDRFSAKAFHERLMRMGTIPAGYFRATFLG